MYKTLGFWLNLGPPGLPRGQGGGPWYRNPLGRGRVPEFLWVFGVFGRFPEVSGRLSCPTRPILESVFLWGVSVDSNLPVKCESGWLEALEGQCAHWPPEASNPPNSYVKSTLQSHSHIYIGWSLLASI